MTPQEHYDKAERTLDASWGVADISVAQVHATLALAGFTRDTRSTPQTDGEEA